MQINVKTKMVGGRFHKVGREASRYVRLWAIYIKRHKVVQEEQIQ